jgi:hypothetical protein
MEKVLARDAVESFLKNTVHLTLEVNAKTVDSMPLGIRASSTR